MENKKIETTKDYLRLVFVLDSMIDDVIADISRLQDSATKITVQTDNERVQTSGSKDILGDTVAKIVDKMEEANMLEDMYIDFREKIKWQIRGIALENTDYYNILRLKYIENKTFDDIAKDIHLTVRRTQSLHGEALDLFEKKYGAEYLGTTFSIRFQNCS